MTKYIRQFPGMTLIGGKYRYIGLIDGDPKSKWAIALCWYPWYVTVDFHRKGSGFRFHPASGVRDGFFLQLGHLLLDLSKA